MGLVWRVLTCRCCYAAEVAGVEYADMDQARARAAQGSRPPAEALREKWIGFLEAMTLGTAKKYDIDTTAYVFQIMLRMYAHKVVVHELEALYSYRPERFIFFVPQFVNFALHGAQDDNMEALESFLLDKSARSLRFAHRLYWFVRAFSPADLAGALIDKTEERALQACDALAPVSSLGVADGVFGETTAGLLPTLEETASPSPSSRARKTAAGDDRTSSPGSPRFEPVKPLPRRAPGPPHVLGVNNFRWAVSFFDELTHMGGTLSAAAEETRNKMLRATLSALQAEYLPSDVMYLPIGKRPSRIVGVVASDSFCFKTNTRVPYMVCLEVVDDFGGLDDDDGESVPVDAGVPDPAAGADAEKSLLRQRSGDIGDRIKSKLGQLRSTLQRRLSTTSHLSPGGVMLQTFSTTESIGSGEGHYHDPIGQPLRVRAESFDEARRGLEGANLAGMSKGMARTPRRSADDAVLGQWTPRSVAASDLPGGGRGAGFSHFVHHKDFDFEDQRDSARQKLAAHGASSGSLAPGSPSVQGHFIDIELESQASVSKKRSTTRSYDSADSMLRALHGVGIDDSEDDDSLHAGALQDAPSAVLPMDDPGIGPDNPFAPLRAPEGAVANGAAYDFTPDLSTVALDADGAGGTARLDEDNLGLVDRRENGASTGPKEVPEIAIDDEEEDEGEDEGTAQTVIFRERWVDKTKRVAAQSRWSHLPSWRLVPIIVKSDDDLRQEQFAAQLIALFDSIFREDGLPLRLHPYDVLAVSPDSGLIQAVPDTISLDSLKKNDTDYTTLRNFFIRYFGRPKSAAFKRAQANFCESLAAYCIVCYILQIKDRHNGNLLLNAEGHIVHIDFGFLLTSQGPGNINFERDVPFKITSEFVQLLDGPDSALFRRFRTLCCKAFLAARKRREQFVLMIEMMLSNEADLDCFQAGGEETIRQMNERFQVGRSTAGCISFVNDLIDVSINHYRTWLYDVYQRIAVGIKY